jgi:calcineurin-like phosphoesterase family protein
MKIYLIADTHFNHKNMVQYCGRPENFTELIGKHLLEVGFTEEDILIHLGDVCIGGDQLIHDLYIKPLRCKKWLLKGNHEHKSDTWYLRNGWDFVGDKLVKTIFTKTILFSHCPTKSCDWFDLNIHGHFHNNLHRLQEGRFVVEGEKERNEIDMANLTEKHKLFAIEETDYRPVLLETFLKEINPISGRKKK